MHYKVGKLERGITDSVRSVNIGSIENGEKQSGRYQAICTGKAY